MDGSSNTRRHVGRLWDAGQRHAGLGFRRAAIAGALMLGMALVVPVAGCSAGGGSASSDRSDLTAQQAAPGAADGARDSAGDSGEAASGAGGEAGGDKAAGDSAAVDPAQQVIVTGDYSLTATDPEASADQIETIAAKAGGHIDSRRQSGSGQGARVTIVVRLPAAATQSALGEITKLGTVTSSQTGTEDVTTQAIDLDQRISALKASIGRLEDMIAKAATTKDLLEVESMLTARQAELQSLTSQRSYLAEQVTYSTITIQLSPKSAPSEARSHGIGDSFASGWNAFVSFVLAILSGLAAAAPFLVLIVLIVALVVLLVRRHRRRHPSKPHAPAPYAAASAPAPLPRAGNGPAPTPAADRTEPTSKASPESPATHGDG